MEIIESIEELENENAYFYLLEALMKRIFDIKVSKMWSINFKKFLKS
tara:strand:+ start:309 stop:449 length:141 start_codon:yes stop_codon:yes gene_type:complete